MTLPAQPLRTWALLLVLTLMTAGALALVPSTARAGHRPNDYCSPNGDFCTETLIKDGARRFRISSLSFSGRYRLCVTGPDELRECKRFTLVEGDRGSYNDSVRWRRHFTYQGVGAYHVSWHKFGDRLGPILGFHVRP
jgi:hypothetical protein